MRDLPVDIEIPHGATLLHIEDRYGPLKDLVRCGLCGTMHGKGYIVCFAIDEIPQFGLMGHVCGKNRFGVAYTAAETQWNIAQRGEELNAAVERFLIRAKRIIPELEAALPRLKWQAFIRVALSKSGEDVLKAASVALKSHDGRLRIEDRALGRIQGKEFWLDFRAFHQARNLAHEVEQFTKYLEGKAAVRDLRKRLLAVQDIEQRWEAIQKAMLDAEEALRPGNLDRLFKAVNGSRLANPQWWDGYVGSHEWKLQVRMCGTVLEGLGTLEGRHGLHWITVADLSKGTDP